MAYATQNDIEKRYGAEAVLLAFDRNSDGSIDVDALSTALSDAE